MTRSFVKIVTVAAVSVILKGPVTSAWACSIPVYQYALERWPADCYGVYVFHRGPLTSKDRAAVDLLENGASEGAGPNVRLHLVDLTSELTPAVRQIWSSQQAPKPPWVVLRYPESLGIDGDLWSGGLNSRSTKAIIDSPARRAILQRLVKGDAAVWVLLESGNKKSDDAAEKVLSTEITKLQKVLASLIGGGEFTGEQPSSDEAPARVAFSTVRVSRKDPAEQVFVNMLVKSEPDLGASSDPMAFPVFGRGRVLYALIGAGISKDNIAEACYFLCGPCSCEVKALNPGFDLLIAADWDEALESVVLVEEPVPPLTGVFPSSAPTETQPTQSGEKAQLEPQAVDSGSGRGLLTTVILLFLGVVTLVVAGSVIVARGGGSRSR